MLGLEPGSTLQVPPHLLSDCGGSHPQTECGLNEEAVAGTRKQSVTKGGKTVNITMASKSLTVNIATASKSPAADKSLALQTISAEIDSNGL